MPCAKMEIPLSTPKVWASMLVACSSTGTCAAAAAATISFIRSALGTGKLRSRPNPRSKNVFTQMPPPLRIRFTAKRGVCAVGSSLVGKFSVFAGSTRVLGKIRKRYSAGAFWLG